MTRSSILSSFGPPAPSPSALQQHLYHSLLEGKTADVAIHVRGSWHAVYHLHRVVLIQSGFFSDLFTAGFAESTSRLNSHFAGPDRIDVLFDDHNITRTAFEICIARLYGGGPSLYLPPSFIPTPSAPLTPAFSASPPADVDAPPGHHPTSPRLLLSLLATALYLSIPSIASHALASIIASVGPFTVVPYLNFAIGHGIPLPAPSEPEAALGLEHIAELIYDEEESEEHSDHDEQTDSAPDSEATSPTTADINALSYVDVQKASSPRQARPTRPPPPVPCAHYGAVSDKVGEAAACWLARWGADMLPHEVRADAALSAKDISSPVPVSASAPGPSSALSTSRKRADTLPSQSSSATDGPSPAPARVPVIWRRGGLGPAWVRELVGSDAMFVRGERERYDIARGVVNLRRASALAETGSLDSEDEREFETMFRDGVYYANLTVEDIIALSHDISPHTGRPYVPLPVLQAAHWSQSLLRCQITARPGATASGNPPGSPASPHPREKELGMSLSMDDVRLRLNGGGNALGIGALGVLDESERVYYPVAVDASHRIGDAAHLENTTSMDALFRPSTASSSGSSANESRLATSEKNFFGLQSERRTAATIVADSTAEPPASSSTTSLAPARWTPYAPCRFSAEFWDVDALREKQRLHSHTVWYAGSLFNVYVQVVRKKASSSSPAGGVQLGVYLHRQSSVDTIPAPSAPFAPAGLSHHGHGHGGGGGAHVHGRNISLPQNHAGGSLPGGSASTPSMIHFSPSIHPPSRSGTPSSAPGTGGSSVLASFLPQSVSTSSSTTGATTSTSTPTTSHTLPALGPPTAPPQPYRDPRAAVSAYFVLGCASATGGALTRFASGPDVFSVSQSWGWKSSALRTEEFLELGPDGAPVPASNGAGGAGGSGGAAPRECSLRVTIVLGLV
ncbi:hypothetical protein CONPUDRAFT_133800 [Coniophora puteana RWD-64-598 SS2]|uniref:BTB domain-containing protein n=1 Tax=Coniophora puteana (strain RWD-64-598) TaxID=741705 RepID=A0A5M3N4X8_CONPW|nr:uncharacterized protein CONPUDRAFT_133800 [Coniophora puteana RWD-64-598 SS2]EIW86358.1 hypothetical protein CONPUDRAFT_133800 [Coniophora puteana RWD-64-598 SS2]